MKKLIAAAAVLVALTSSVFAAGTQRPVAYADNPDLIGQHHTSTHLLLQGNPTSLAPATANTQPSVAYASNPDLVGQSHTSGHLTPANAVVR